MVYRQICFPNRRLLFSTPFNSLPRFAQYSTKSNPYPLNVGILEFFNGIGNGVEQYTVKLESEFRVLNELLVTRGMKFKRLGIGGKG